MTPTPIQVVHSLRLEDGRRWGDAALDFQREDAEAILNGDWPYAFLTRGRGGSKTTDLAAVATALLLTATDRVRHYWLAADVGQGRLCIDAIQGFVDRTPGLRDALTITSNSVEAHSSGAILTVLTSDASSSWGLRPTVAYVDEISMWPDGVPARRLWESISSSVAKLPNARMVVLCTAGDPAHFSARIRDHALTSPLWHVHETPGPVPWLSDDRLAEQKARLMPSTYTRLFLNVWSAGEDRLASPEAIRACVVLDGPLEHSREHRYVLSLDIGLRRDRTVAAVCHVEEGRVVVLDRMGVWSGSHENPVVLGEVEEWVARCATIYRARLIVDPYQAVGLMQRLSARGLAAEEFTFSASSVGRLAQTLFTCIHDGSLHIPDDPELIDELGHVRLRETSPGVFRMDHDASRHDDRAVALAMAAHALLSDAQAPTNLTAQIKAVREAARAWKPGMQPTGEELLGREVDGRTTEELWSSPRRGHIDRDLPTFYGGGV